MVELDLLEGDDTLAEGHRAHVLDGEALGSRCGREQGGGNRQENDLQESAHDGVPLPKLGVMDGCGEPISVARTCLAAADRQA